MAKVDVQVPGRFFYPEDALRKACRTLGSTHWPPYSEHDVDRYLDPHALGTQNEMKMPFIWLSDVNSYGVDAIRTGSHGFAWMSSIDCANLDLVHAFHLLNSPGAADQWKQRKWNYCGKYYAHRTGYHMSVDGWKRLPRATREAAALIRAGHPDNKGSTAADMYAKFESGELSVELVIFQFCGLPSTAFSDLLDRDAALALRSAKPPRPPPKKLDRENIFLKHPETYEAWQQIQDRMGVQLFS
ncbi:hypothetical protein L226DRAFT_536299 [Lentinus tigrinus ALCF2SS1-7]|nr:hypothetical protein L226DRAFT_536299 [Lentinus tigrinus ALCF2SS1-7]